MHLNTWQGKIEYIQPSITSEGIHLESEIFRVCRGSQMLLNSRISRKYIDEFQRYECLSARKFNAFKYMAR